MVDIIVATTSITVRVTIILSVKLSTLQTIPNVIMLYCMANFKSLNLKKNVRYPTETRTNVWRNTFVT